MLTVKAIKCSMCEDIIYSRARHDYHSCSCGCTSIDGGFDYIRCGWKSNEGATPPVPFDLCVDSTKKELYNDWNDRINKYGIIKKDESTDTVPTVHTPE